MTDVYVYAALLLHKAQAPITVDSVDAVLTAVGLERDENRVKSLVAALKDVDIEQALAAAGRVKAQPIAATTEPEKPPESAPESKKKDDQPDDMGLTKLFGD